MSRPEEKCGSWFDNPVRPGGVMFFQWHRVLLQHACEAVCTGQDRRRFESASAQDPFFSKAVVYGQCLMTLSLTVNEVLHWLTQLLATMQTHSSDDSVALGIVPYPPPHRPSLPPPPPPPPISWDLGPRQYLSRDSSVLNKYKRIQNVKGSKERYLLGQDKTSKLSW